MTVISLTHALSDRAQWKYLITFTKEYPWKINWYTLYTNGLVQYLKNTRNITIKRYPSPIIAQEHQKNNPSLVVENAEMNNVAYLFKCEGSTLTVKGKINGIIVDSCKKCSILFENLVSSIEFVNCQSVQMQVLGSVPTISIDKTDGCQMYLSEQSLGVEIISSKSSEMNVLIPDGTGDFVSAPDWRCSECGLIMILLCRRRRRYPNSSRRRFPESRSTRSAWKVWARPNAPRSATIVLTWVFAYSNHTHHPYTTIIHTSSPTRLQHASLFKWKH